MANGILYAHAKPSNQNIMAIRKEKRLSPLKDKASKKEVDDNKPDLSYEGGLDAQKDQLNDVPKNTEDWQNVKGKGETKYVHPKKS